MTQPTAPRPANQTQECPHCFTEIDARATVCPQCRRSVVSSSTSTSTTTIKVILGLGLVALASLCFLVVGLPIIRQLLFMDIMRTLTEPASEPSSDQRISPPIVDFGEEITYTISGNGRANITVVNEDGDTRVLRDVPLPNSYSFDKGTSDELYVSAVTREDGMQTIGCEIYAGEFNDYRLLASDEVTADGALVTCRVTAR